MTPIKNIIFDLGNVLLDLDLGATGRRLSELSGGSFDAARTTLQASGIFETYEVGGISSEEFVDAISQAFSPALPHESVVEAWNAILLGFPAERFEMLLRLRERYSVFLLSNINDLHARWIDDYMAREHGLTDWHLPHFDTAYYSHFIRLRKPNRDIYEYVLADADLRPEETIFFDDLEPNIAGAQAVGIRGILHPAGTDIVRRVQNVLAEG